MIKKVEKKKFLLLGYGINAYFLVLEYFIKLFFLLTLINVSIMIYFGSYDGMKTISGVPFSAATSIGNLGFSSTVCKPVNFGVDKNIITCQYGSI